MNGPEGLYVAAVSKFTPGEELAGFDEKLKQHERDFHFAMHCNGLFMLSGGKWVHSPEAVTPFLEEFKGQNVSFYGPESKDRFFSSEVAGQEHFSQVFSQHYITDAIRKYREIDEDEAARIAFLFGGIVRIGSTAPDTMENAELVARAVEFVARMSLLGDRKSGDAVTSAAAMYVLSGGDIQYDNNFAGNVYHMGEAVSEDQISPRDTLDLGLSQTLRLRAFMDKVKFQEPKPVPDIGEQIKALEKFPTVGAEFHFPADIADQSPDFWRKLALLNMSSYQRGSYIQMSRNDRGVIEVRMNPSVYPISIANWNHMRLILPEMDEAFFTLTINRPEERSFRWTNKNDEELLNNLRGLGMLSYAGLFEDVPHLGRPEEIDFGSIYLGQTVKLIDGEYKYTGLWNGKEGNNGQLAIYAGFGDTFPHLAYYLSMALADPNIFDSFKKNFFRSTRTLDQALSVTADNRKGVFNMLQARIDRDRRLREASEAGHQIIELLNP